MARLPAEPNSQLAIFGAPKFASGEPGCGKTNVFEGYDL
jgi:hypothetical protein